MWRRVSLCDCTLCPQLRRVTRLALAFECNLCQKWGLLQGAAHAKALSHKGFMCKNETLSTWAQGIVQPCWRRKWAGLLTT
jgi:hypothetical protein